MANWYDKALSFIVTVLEIGGLLTIAIVVLAVTAHGIRWAYKILYHAISPPQGGNRFGR